MIHFIKRPLVTCLLPLTLFVGTANAKAEAPVVADNTNWTGLYAGLNAGYGWSGNNSFNTVGTPGIAGIVSGSIGGTLTLANVATNQLSLSTDGFIGGLQAGYNWQLSSAGIVGVEIEIEGSGAKDSITFNKTDQLIGFPNDTYRSNIEVTKKINWLASLRGRFGILSTPNLLFFGTGGITSGRVSNTLSFSEAEFNNNTQDPNLPPFVSSINREKSLTGWTAGVGAEWMVKENWSAKVEYSYVDLGTLHTSLVLAQNGLSGGVLLSPFASATANSSTKFTEHYVRVGINHYFDI